MCPHHLFQQHSTWSAFSAPHPCGPKPPSGVLQPLSGFSSVSAKVSFAVRSGVDLEVAAANVLDQNYQPYAGYPEPGRIISVNLRYRF
jgi:outer membrane receptor protein involved in Fe transport